MEMAIHTRRCIHLLQNFHEAHISLQAILRESFDCIFRRLWRRRPKITRGRGIGLNGPVGAAGARSWDSEPTEVVVRNANTKPAHDAQRRTGRTVVKPTLHQRRSDGQHSVGSGHQQAAQELAGYIAANHRAAARENEARIVIGGAAVTRRRYGVIAHRAGESPWIRSSIGRSPPSAACRRAETCRGPT